MLYILYYGMIWPGLYNYINIHNIYIYYLYIHVFVIHMCTKGAPGGGARAFPSVLATL